MRMNLAVVHAIGLISAGPIANLRGRGWGLALGWLGWTCSEPLRTGWWEGAAAQAGRMSRCAVHLHSLGREHNLGLKSFSQYPSPHPSCLSAVKPVGSHYLAYRDAAEQLKVAIHIHNTRIDS